MYEIISQIWWTLVIMVVFVAGSDLETIPDCIGCRNEHAELGEYLKSQKIAHRLEYIKQQLINNLHVQSVPIETPKFDSLPDFLVQKLVYEDTSNKASDSFVDGTNDEPPNRQMVLFVEEENTTCGSSTRRGLCLNFKLSEDVLSSDLSFATIWFHKKNLPIQTSGTHNFTIADKTSLNARNRMGKNITINSITEKDGWYQIDVTLLVKSWLVYKVSKHRVLMISCDSCVGTEYATSNTTSQNSNNTSFLFLNTENEENARLKRGVDCTPGREECCREDLWVEFSELGDQYKMVVNPPKFNAYVCRGNCYLSSPSSAVIHKPYADLLSTLKRKKQEEYAMTTTCCTPTQLAGLPVVFAKDKLTLQKVTIPNLVVESCGCV